MGKIKGILKSNWKLVITALVFTICLVTFLFVCIFYNKTIEVSSMTRAVTDYENQESLETEEEQKDVIGAEVSEEELNSVRADINDKATNTSKYFIQVNYVANVVTIYQKDENDEYTIPYKAMVCSCGKATPTSGVYKMTQQYRWHKLLGSVSGQYCSRIVGSILFHSVPYAEYGNPASLKYTAFDKLGTKASAGCIRLQVADALWIYNNCGAGTKVEFYGDSNPGPLGKPTARKISGESAEVRNWDPTDPDPRNPWKNYKGNSNSMTTTTTTDNASTQEQEEPKKEETTPVIPPVEDEKPPEKEPEKEPGKDDNVVEDNKTEEENDNDKEKVEP